jgi:hypothetical protein
MARLRLLLLTVAVVALAGVASSVAVAAPPPVPSCSPSLPESVSSAHFVVHYDGDPQASDYTTETEAGDVAADAERAYAAYLGMGFPALPGTIDISVIDLSPYDVSSYICFGSVDFGVADIGQDDEAYNVGFDVFDEVEFGVYFPSTYPDYWLTQGFGSWASWKALGYPASSTSDLGPFEMSLDCFDTSFGNAKCSKNGSYENLGQSRWPFYEYLAERFGINFAIEALTDAQSAGGSLAGLQNALATHGATLSGVYADYATKLMSGGWTSPALNVATPPISGAPILTGATTGDIAPQTFSVDHLATRYVEIDRGDGSAAHACYAATLKLTVQIPSGVSSQPTFFWNGGGGSPVPLAVSGSTATATVPWDTCLWTSKGFLSLPNASTSVNGVNFVVSAHLTVDTTTPATASPPPTPSSTYGPTINVTNASVAPSVSVFGPQILQLSPTDSQIRLIVESDGEGSLKAALGSTSLGNSSLRPGENDLRFTLPQGTLLALRKSADANNLLTLTPVSVDGSASGKAVTRQVTVTASKTASAAPKAKPKAKPKSKPKPKSKKSK